MFTDRSYLLLNNLPRLYYGVAVIDVDGDGDFEWVIAGFGFPNRAYKWNGAAFNDVATPELADVERQAIGVAGCDLDGDGDEEIYILNTDTFAGRKRFADRLFDRADGIWTDLFAMQASQHVLNLTAGRSVIALDRDGDGLYGFFVSNYGGPMRLYELDEDGRLRDSASSAGLDFITGGRSAVALPLVTPRLDIFAGNEGGPNFLFLNRDDGTYEDVAGFSGLSDPYENARGVAILDANDDGLFDIVCGNWEGPHRLFIQMVDGTFRDSAPRELAVPSRIRTVIAADFDNDGYEEIFFNNIGQPNRLFARRDGEWKPITIGDALEPGGLGTGAAVGDLDGDGRLELLIAHGESGMQPISLYHTPVNHNHWLRIMPLTRAGAPARGALVTLHAGGREQRRVIDSGSGYLCQMEPVAHFGLGALTEVESVEVRWPDGMFITLRELDADQMLRVEYPR
ncbi:MAG: CRTAC1 family protein [Anaerolineae bacterium]|nr:CRTAC1 family protein [Anaerolineae bacterium]